LKRNEFQPLAAAEVVGRLSILIGLPELIVAEFLFEAGRDGYQRRHPVGLLRLDASRECLPVVDKLQDHVA